MSVTVQQVVDAVERWAPPILALENDKIGLQMGRLNRPVRRVWLALDPSPTVVEEAVTQKADMLLTHHAMLFHPLRRIDTATARGRAIALALTHDLTVYNAHTNLDVAPGGVNDVLTQLLHLHDAKVLDVTYQERTHIDEKKTENAHRQPTVKEFGMGRIGNLGTPVSLATFADFVRNVLELSGIRYAGDPEFMVNRVAVVGGSGGRWTQQAILKGADVMVTADCDHHTMAEAWQDGLAMVDATHAAMERPVLKWLQQQLQHEFGDALQVIISEVVEDPYRWG